MVSLVTIRVLSHVPTLIQTMLIPVFSHLQPESEHALVTGNCSIEFFSLVPSLVSVCTTIAILVRCRCFVIHPVCALG